MSQEPAPSPMRIYSARPAPLSLPLASTPHCPTARELMLFKWVSLLVVFKYFHSGASWAKIETFFFFFNIKAKDHPILKWWALTLSMKWCISIQETKVALFVLSPKPSENITLWLLSVPRALLREDRQGNFPKKKLPKDERRSQWRNKS